MLGLLVPYQTTALPLYLGFHKAGLLNSYSALIAPFVCSVFAIFLFRQFFKAIPDDLINAARIDGMSEFSIVWRVVMPNAWPAATAFAIFSVVAHWNDLFWPLIVIQKGDLYTPAMGILAFARSSRARITGADGGGRAHHRAVGPRVPFRPAPFHRRHHHDGPQGMRPSLSHPNQEVSMTTNLSRRDGLAIIGGAAAGVFMPAVARAQAAEIQVHYSMPAIFKEAQDAVMAAFQVKHPEVKATYVNPTPTYEERRATASAQRRHRSDAGRVVPGP